MILKNLYQKQSIVYSLKWMVYETGMTKEQKMVGYARVSTNEQNIDMQVDALMKAGCDKQHMFVEKISGVKKSRPQLDACLESLQAGDVLVVYRLDRLGRSMSNLVGIIENLREHKIGFKSLCDGAIDTTTASGELVFNIFSSMAQFERRLIQERTDAGLKAARARGRRGGRPKILADEKKVQAVKRMHQDNTMPIGEICSLLGISRPTFYRYLSL